MSTDDKQPQPYEQYLSALFAPAGGYTSYLDGLFNAQLGLQKPGATTKQEPAGAAPQEEPTADPPAPAFSDYSGAVKYHDGTEFDAGQLRTLAGQIAQNFDYDRSAGGAFGTQGESIGFDYGEASKLYTAPPTAADQVMLDMAAGLLRNGVTDISQLARKNVVHRADAREAQHGDGHSFMTTPQAVRRSAVVRKTEDGKYVPINMDTRSAAFLQQEGYNHGMDQVYDSLDDEQYTDADRLKYGAQLQKTLPNLNSAGLGSSMTGKGGTYYGLDFNEQGQPVFSTRHVDTSDKDAIGMALSVLALPAAGALAPALQGAMPALGSVGSQAAAGAVTGGLQSAATGGNFLKGALTGGVLGGVGGLDIAGNYLGIGKDLMGGAAHGAVNGAIKGAAGAALNGGDIGKSALGGVVGGVVNGLNPAGALGLTDPRVSAAVNAALSSGAGGLAVGRPMDQAALGAAMAALTAGTRVAVQPNNNRR